jgi:hypothetical protein
MLARRLAPSVLWRLRAISGHIWHDECAVPHESTAVAPPGCVILPDGTMGANGILDLAEIGIDGVTVLLAAGACPGTDGWSCTTEVNGHYGFCNLSGGIHCLEIAAASDGNESVLIPGNWTVPCRWHGPGPISAEVTLPGDDDIRRYNDFAWDYQLLPEPAPATSAPSPMVRATQNANCRFGPSTQFDPSAILNQGDTAAIQGRKAESTRWFVLPTGERSGCWAWAGAVEPSGDLSEVPVRASPPMPTPLQGCWVYNQQQQPVCTVPCPPNPIPGGTCTP